jgi:error-prone DNA polymerase
VGSFALYGFPESHAISFAHLAYASAYLKAHRAPEFFASLLNNQPMGFYAPATLIKDGQRHGVKFRPVCVAQSDWPCTIEDDHSVRLGLCVVNILSHSGALKLLAERKKAPFASLDDFKRRVRLSKDELRILAEIGALNGFADHRRQALWEVEKTIHDHDLFETPAGATPSPRPPKASPLAPMNYPERIRADFSGMNLTTGKHPMALLRPGLKNIWRATDLPKGRNGLHIRIAGNVICRQRPGTAKGFVFISLEDETGVSNAIVEPPVFEANRLLITEESFLMIEGKLQHVENVIHIKAEKIERLEHGSLSAPPSYDFR